ncbi:calcitonin gene-related peptide type 1 receptor-like [Mercenaria mercenaria]|uniref:calcitonin gene-related peptide type 1 receptor-like n=1 Tax=Mercenaria mercenaria TaxID=6596 RepID=UPI00234E9F6C|nr:calcitonin gene-related peptide type 1 receptor-like [Mercenaria mercenaria]XP_053374643.1 calcitonin gene-related peptide type 1 receptor-like [Mercenaria mercenaria]
MKLSPTVVLFIITHFPRNILGDNLMGRCRGKMGIYDKQYFNKNSCAWCYFFLFQGNNFIPTYSDYLTVLKNGSTYPVGTQLIADPYNSTTRQSVCSTLQGDECDMWTHCCNAARACCDKQLQEHYRTDNTSCPVTWDGYACWDGGTAGLNSYLNCPNYLRFSIPTKMALKTCRANGTWFTKDGLEWTDYTSCLSYKDIRVTIFISVGCQVASLLLLVPSLIIFFKYKNLRRQHRIRIHINFFISFIMSNTLGIMWNLLVTYDKITNVQVMDTLMNRNTASCKLLSFLKLYFASTNYSWMFCEGFYLYRLISNAFSPPKRLLFLYLAGWGIPFIYCGTYAVIRIATANKSCWAIGLGDKEWIIYAPNLACLMVNVFFLCSILRILLTQLQAHPNEPSHFRRALKATFVLIPLFGVQLAVTIYRQALVSQEAVHYERFSEIVINSQGLIVALIFCFFNGEVASQIMRSWRRFHWQGLSSSKRLNATLSLHFNNSLTQRTENVHSRRNSLEPCISDGQIASTPVSKESQPL